MFISFIALTNIKAENEIEYIDKKIQDISENSSPLKQMHVLFTSYAKSKQVYLR